MFLIKKAIFTFILVLGFVYVLFINEANDSSLQNNAEPIAPQLANEDQQLEELRSKQEPKATKREAQPKKEKINLNPFGLMKPPKPLAIMLFGVDRTVEEKYGRSDSIMLALAEPKTKEIMLISIPRDTYIAIPGYGFNKLNTSFQLGGPNLTKQTVENWLNFKISDTVTIDYANFEKLIDTIGGIEINVDRRMVHSEYVLEEGVQTLSGKEALRYVRFRKSADGRHDSDYKRTERQRQVLSQLLDDLLKKRSFSESFALLRSLINTIDTSLSMQQIINYGHHFSDFSSENITTLSFHGEGVRYNGLWYEHISEAELEEKKQLIHDFMNSQEVDDPN